MTIQRGRHGVEAWPTLFVLDKHGRVRWTHVGEGVYDETEQVIKKLLAEEEPPQHRTILNDRYKSNELNVRHYVAGNLTHSPN